MHLYFTRAWLVASAWQVVFELESPLGQTIYLNNFNSFFAKKWLSPKKFVMGKNFRFRYFRFGISFETFWIDLIQKNIPKILDCFYFFTILVIKWLSPRRNFVMEKISILRFSPYVLKRSESIQIKENFYDQNFFDVVMFSQLWPKMTKSQKKFCNWKKKLSISVLKYLL